MLVDQATERFVISSILPSRVTTPNNTRPSSKAFLLLLYRLSLFQMEVSFQCCGMVLGLKCSKLDRPYVAREQFELAMANGQND